jgi:hypothetical protein
MSSTIYYIIYLVILVWSLYDIWTGKLDQGKKILWTILCVILGVIGTLIYFFVGRKK